METIGVQYLKVDQLNYRAYVLKQEDMEPVFIVGHSRLPTPGLSAVSSLKPSVTKSEIAKRIQDEKEFWLRIKNSKGKRDHFLWTRMRKNP